MQVSEVMTRGVGGVSPESPLRSIIIEMAAQQHSCKIVLQDNRPVGIITERDVLQYYAKWLASEMPDDCCARDVMTQDPVCIEQSTEFKDALMLSRSRALRHLPVVDEQHQLVGLVTQTDLVNAYSLLLDREEELMDSLAEMRLLSLEDPLMGIGNRRAMEVDLSFTEAESRRHNKSYAVALLDIDFFKLYNDLFGHLKGDDALREVARIIKASTRDYDRVFRYGGEEILVLMPETDLEAALVCAERIREAVEAEAIPHPQSAFNVLTLSAGVESSGDQDWKSVVAAADQGLYQAKRSGRNQVATVRQLPAS